MVRYKGIFLKNRTAPAFTIVELLVVIVIIGVLASITIVSYSGITKRANAAVLQSDLSNASKKIVVYNALYGSYPVMSEPDAVTGVFCPESPRADMEYCIKPSNGNTLKYSTNPADGFVIIGSKGNTTYSVNKNTSPVAWLEIGSQVWSKTNLNIGQMISGTTEQTDNGVVEKYCYNDLESNCNQSGALYQWNEAMGYESAEASRGICPYGSHIPSDAELKTLEMHLGMSQAQADAVGYRGTDQGSQMKLGGSSGLDIPMAGGRQIDGVFSGIDTDGLIWTSTESGASALQRNLDASDSIYRSIIDKPSGISVRCLRD